MRKCTLDIAFTQGRAIGLLAVATSDHVILFSLSLLILEVDDGLQVLNVAITRQLGSLLRFMLWLAFLKMTLR
jgi:hypothetical protein